MIFKQRRSYVEEKYNIIIEDKNGKRFTMTVGGNQDLFWCPEDMKDNNAHYTIDNTDKELYRYLNRLFQLIEERDDKNEPCLSNNVFTFYSEDIELELANKLEIIKNEKSFDINFYKNNVNSYSNCSLRISNYICFCNSGSKIPKVEQLFMIMFNHMAYQNDKIDIMLNDNILCSSTDYIAQQNVDNKQASYCKEIE